MTSSDIQNWISAGLSTTLGARGFSLVGDERNERRSREAETKNISNSQNDQLLDGLMAQL